MAGSPTKRDLEPPATLRVFLALEGGGAKGLVHVGAIRALEEQGVVFRGVAGTSAGAIVAALKAVGFTADDIINPAQQSTILTRLGEDFQNTTDFFGPAGWPRIRLFRAALKWTRGWRLEIGSLTAVGLFVASLLFAANEGPIWAVLCVFLWLLAVLGVGLSLRKGLASVKSFRDALDRALREKIEPGRGTDPVRFSDLNSGHPILKIVATDISAGQLKLFSPDETPNVSIADAVAASVCLPVIFQVWECEGNLYLDGGLVSNLPAWPFDEERGIDPDALTIAVEIVDRPESEGRATSSNWITQVVRTAVFGSGVLNKRAVGRFETVSLETDLDLLAFDTAAEDVFRIVAEATAAARARIVRRLIEEPRVLHTACEAVQDLVARALRRTPSLFPDGGFGGRVRVALAMQEEGFKRSLRLRHGVGYEADTDEALLLPIQGSFVGKAWTDEESVFTSLGPGAEAAGIAPDKSFLTAPENRQRNRLIWKELAWSLCVPIHASRGLPGTSKFVVAVDGNDTIDEQAPELQETLNLLEQRITTIFDEALEGLAGK